MVKSIVVEPKLVVMNDRNSKEKSTRYIQVVQSISNLTTFNHFSRILILKVTMKKKITLVFKSYDNLIIVDTKFVHNLGTQHIFKNIIGLK